MVEPLSCFYLMFGQGSWHAPKTKGEPPESSHRVALWSNPPQLSGVRKRHFGVGSIGSILRALAVRWYGPEPIRWGHFGSSMVVLHLLNEERPSVGPSF